MKKVSSILASLPLITTACGGGGSNELTGDNTQTSSIDLSQAKGIWSLSGTQTFTGASGKQITLQAPTALITSDENMIILTGTSELYVIKPDTEDAHFFTSFGYGTPLTSETSVSNDQFIFDFYNPDRDESYIVTLPRNGHYDAAINLSDLADIWTDEYTNSNIWTFTINTNGSFTAERQFGTCLANGSFTHIDPTKSELSVSVTFTGNCENLEGTHTGLAWPDESTPNNTLNIAIYNGFELNSKAYGWKLTRP